MISVSWRGSVLWGTVASLALNFGVMAADAASGRWKMALGSALLACGLSLMVVDMGLLRWRGAPWLTLAVAALLAAGLAIRGGWV